MKRYFRGIWYLAVGLALALPGGVSCGSSHDGHDHSPAHNHEEGHVHDAEEGHDHGAETGHAGSGEEIIIEPERAKTLGIVSEPVSAGEFTDMLSLSGRIEAESGGESVASSPASGIFTLSPGIEVGTAVKAGQAIGRVKTDATQSGDIGAASRARLAAAKRELDRLKPLLEERLITVDRYNSALAEYETARALCSSTGNSGVVTSPISGVVTSLTASTGSYVGEGSPVATISKSGRLNLVVLVPSRHAAASQLANGAIFRLAGSEEWHSLSSLEGRRVSSSAYTEQQGGYLQVRFSFRNPGGVGAGAYADVKLPVGSRGGVVSVPKEALTEQQGSHFVYVKVDEEGYEKRKVQTGGDDGFRVEILEGLKAGENVVTKGAMMVKLAETATAAPEGHSHSH